MALARDFKPREVGPIVRHRVYVMIPIDGWVCHACTSASVKDYAMIWRAIFVDPDDREPRIGLLCDNCFRKYHDEP